MFDNFLKSIRSSYLLCIVKSNPILLLLCFLYYGWSASNGKFEVLAWTQTPEGYLNSLAEAFRHGQTHLLLSPDSKLLALSDPYDPVQRSTLPEGIYAMHDASLFNGHYFLYFTPVLSLFFLLPFRVLSGHFLSEILLGALLAYSAALLLSASIMKVLEFRNSLYATKRIQRVVIISAFSITGFPYIIRRLAYYELSILSGVFFLSLFFYFVTEIAIGQRGLQLSNKLLTYSGLSLGLAIWSRPHLILYFFCLIPILIYRVYQTSKNAHFSRISLLAKKFLIALSPILVIVGLMATYNYMRYKSIFEFGISYILGPADLREIGLFNFQNLPIGIFGYLFTFPDFNYSFPFVHLRPQIAPMAINFPFGGEHLMGLFALPTSLILLTLLRKPKVNSREGQGLDYLLNVSFLLGSLGVLLVLSLTALTASRYTMEFYPAYTIIVTSIFAPAFARPPIGLRDNLYGAMYGTVIRGIAILAILLQVFSGLEGYGLTFQTISPNQFQFLKNIFEGPLHLIFHFIGIPAPQ
jgi:hypothetical protein